MVDHELRLSVGRKLYKKGNKSPTTASSVLLPFDAWSPCLLPGLSSQRMFSHKWLNSVLDTSQTLESATQ